MVVHHDRIKRCHSKDLPDWLFREKGVINGPGLGDEDLHFSTLFRHDGTTYEPLDDVSLPDADNEDDLEDNGHPTIVTRTGGPSKFLVTFAITNFKPS